MCSPRKGVVATKNLTTLGLMTGQWSQGSIQDPEAEHNRRLITDLSFSVNENTGGDRPCGHTHIYEYSARVMLADSHLCSIQIM